MTLIVDNDGNICVIQIQFGFYITDFSDFGLSVDPLNPPKSPKNDGQKSEVKIVKIRHSERGSSILDYREFIVAGSLAGRFYMGG